MLRLYHILAFLIIEYSYLLQKEKAEPSLERLRRRACLKDESFSAIPIVVKKKARFFFEIASRFMRLSSLVL